MRDAIAVWKRRRTFHTCTTRRVRARVHSTICNVLNIKYALIYHHFAARSQPAAMTSNSRFFSVLASSLLCVVAALCPSARRARHSAGLIARSNWFSHKHTHTHTVRRRGRRRRLICAPYRAVQPRLRQRQAAAAENPRISAAASPDRSRKRSTSYIAQRVGGDVPG